MLGKSALVKYLLERAEQLKQADGREALSGNYFLASVLETMADMTGNRLAEDINNEAAIAELKEIGTLLEEYQLDPAEAARSIRESVQDKDYNSTVDEFVFGRINYRAEAKAKKMKRKAIDAYVLVSMILEEPTDIIREQLFEKKTTASDTAERLDDDIAAMLARIEELTASMDIPTDLFGEKETPAAPATSAAEDAVTDAPVETAGLAGGLKHLAETVNKTREIQKFLLANIFGQDQAINTFVSGYFQSEIMSQFGKAKNKPAASFLFAGPPGVGKTFLAEKAAEALGLPFMRFDMSEYAEKESALEFCGSDNVYKNSKGGNLTTFVEENPRCVLLFDEIEKSHISIIHLFLQILDAGRVRDSKSDEEISFADAVLIFTTNAGRNLYSDITIPNLSTLPRKKVLKALSTDVNPITKVPMFPEAICSRFASGNVVMFNRLDAHNLFVIAEKEMRRHMTAFEENTGISVQMDTKVPTAIILSEGGNADARTVKGRATSFFYEELYEFFRLLFSDPQVAEKLKTIKLSVNLEGVEPAISRMFVDTAKPEVLIFADESKLASVPMPLAGVTCHITNDIEKAKEILFSNDISIILCDVYCGERDAGIKVLNAEDVISAGHDFLQLALTSYSTPVFLLQDDKRPINEEEFLSFAKVGVRDIVCIKNGKKNSFEAQVLEKCMTAYQQTNMQKLAQENKVISFKTAQIIAKSKKSAEITLFGFKTILATDSEESKSILDNVSKPGVRFTDVIGAEDAKKELTYFVEYLKNPVKYMRKGVRAPKGVLLYGPPGTGKTLLAKAMAGESDVTFLVAEGNQFIKHYYGDGPESVHKLFATARKYAPSIIFIDEIDVIAQNRQTGGENASDLADILTAFLAEMDGFKTDTSKPVFVLAATNYSVEQTGRRTLDPAMLRRFDRHIYVDLPNKEERKKFLYKKVAGSKMVELSDEQIENIAVRSTGMSLAELDSVYEMALRNAIRSNDCRVDDRAFEEAFETFSNGEVKQWNQDSLERTARHEAGHALLYWLGGEKPSYVTIVARGDHGGYMQHADNEGKGSYTKAELLNRIRTSLAGRAAEIVYYGSEDGISTGASGDLASATRTAEHMIGCYGMDEKVGLSYLGDDKGDSLYYNIVRQRANEILALELQHAIDIIASHKPAVDAMVAKLLEKNCLKENEIDEIFRATIKQ